MGPADGTGEEVVAQQKQRRKESWLKWRASEKGKAYMQRRKERRNARSAKDGCPDHSGEQTVPQEQQPPVLGAVGAGRGMDEANAAQV